MVANAAAILKSHELVDCNCQICLETLRSPVTLPCGHNFCFGCVVTWSETRGGNRKCPTCRAPLPRECNTNVNLARIVQALPTSAV